MSFKNNEIQIILYQLDNYWLFLEPCLPLDSETLHSPLALLPLTLFFLSFLLDTCPSRTSKCLHCRLNPRFCLLTPKLFLSMISSLPRVLNTVYEQTGITSTDSTPSVPHPQNNTVCHFGSSLVSSIHYAATRTLKHSGPICSPFFRPGKCPCHPSIFSARRLEATFDDLSLTPHPMHH